MEERNDEDKPLGALMVKGSEMAKRNGKVSNPVRNIQIVS